MFHTKCTYGSQPTGTDLDTLQMLPPRLCCCTQFPSNQCLAGFCHYYGPIAHVMIATIIHHVPLRQGLCTEAMQGTLLQSCFHHLWSSRLRSFRTEHTLEIGSSMRHDAHYTLPLSFSVLHLRTVFLLVCSNRAQINLPACVHCPICVFSGCLPSSTVFTCVACPSVLPSYAFNICVDAECVFNKLLMVIPYM